MFRPTRPLKAVAPPRFANLRLLAIACAVVFCCALVPAVAQTQTQTATPAPAARPAEGPSFEIFEFVVQGNSVLSAEDIERAVYPFMGEKRSVDDVQAARAALEKLYRDRGYGSTGVDIPEQRVEGGVVALQVVEGRISRTRVTGSRYFSQGFILAAVTAAAEGEVPHFPTLQAQLGSVNRTADRRVAPLLRPGKEPGTTEVDLVVEDKLPLHGSVELNNRASLNTSETRLLASLRYDNLFQRDHSVSLQVQTSPEATDEVRVLSASYTVPTGAAGQDSLVFSFTRSDSTVPAGAADTTLFGKGSIWGLRYNNTLLLREREYHLLTLGVDYKRFDDVVDVGGKADLTTPIRYLPLSANYLGILEDDAGRWQLGAGISAGLRGLVNDQKEFADKRSGANGSYGLVKFDLTRDHKLPWSGLTARARVDAQFAGRPLISNEQFVVGGADSVRGYLESAAVGDTGLRASFELRSAELAGATWPWLGSLTLHSFAEGAVAHVHRPLRGQSSRFSLLGAGFGARLKGKSLGSLALDFGWPLRALVNTERGDLRVHASGVFEF